MLDTYHETTWLRSSNSIILEYFDHEMVKFPRDKAKKVNNNNAMSTWSEKCEQRMLV